MKKTLNINISVRHMQAQNILTASAITVSDETISGTEGSKVAVEAPGRGSVRVAPVRAGF